MPISIRRIVKFVVRLINGLVVVLIHILSSATREYVWTYSAGMVFVIARQFISNLCHLNITIELRALIHVGEIADFAQLVHMPAFHVEIGFIHIFN